MIRPDWTAAVAAFGAAMKPRRTEQMTRSEQLRSTADAMLGVAAEVQRAYDEQRNGGVNWRLSRDDVTAIARVALTLQHDADVWDWQQDPLVAQRIRSGLSVDNVDGLPARPPAPRFGRASARDLPQGFPSFSLSWSEMATEFLSTRRGARGGDDARGID